MELRESERENREKKRKDIYNRANYDFSFSVLG